MRHPIGTTHVVRTRQSTCLYYAIILQYNVNYMKNDARDG
jgi:hypothetical protein